MDRRRFLTVLAVGTAATLAGSGALDGGSSWPTLEAGLPLAIKAAQRRSLQPATRPGVRRLPPQTYGSSVPPRPGPATPTKTPVVIDHLPAVAVPRFALTIDDGVSAAVLEAYVDFVIASGIRLTFFVNGVYDSWTSVRPKLAPLVDSGQVQLGNHTWNHPSITTLSAAKIVSQLNRNETFLRRTYGVEGRPYFRPPYGHHNAATDKVTGGLGYDRTVMWYGSLGDSTIVSPAQIVAAAQQWFRAGHVVIGHANFPNVTHDYVQLVELIRERNLQTVTLRDVFGDEPMAATR